MSESENPSPTTKVRELIAEIGMQRLLAELIESLDGNKHEHYISLLKMDLEHTLRNYSRRHDNESDTE